MCIFCSSKICLIFVQLRVLYTCSQRSCIECRMSFKALRFCHGICNSNKCLINFEFRRSVSLHLIAAMLIFKQTSAQKCSHMGINLRSSVKISPAFSAQAKNAALWKQGLTVFTIAAYITTQCVKNIFNICFSVVSIRKSTDFFQSDLFSIVYHFNGNFSVGNGNSVA